MTRKKGFLNTTSLAIFLLSIFSPQLYSAEPNILKFRGTCDSSAAVAISPDSFVVADDENNELRIYKITGNFFETDSFDTWKFLKPDNSHPEADIEAAALVGDRIYWITSHGRNKNGKPRPSRYRFFATDIKTKHGDISMVPTGQSCDWLIDAMLMSPKLKHLDLEKYVGSYLTEQKKSLAPKKRGLNIEGLCASPNGKIMYLGLRNPQFKKDKKSKSKAIVIPLLNAADVIEKAAPPIFDEPLLWDLKGLGIRSIEYSPSHKSYFIVAGPKSSGGKFYLYQWSGKKVLPPKMIRQLAKNIPDFTPEALVSFKDSSKMLLISDDGSLIVDVGCECDCDPPVPVEPFKCPNKYLIDQAQKTFRAIWINPTPPKKTPASRKQTK